MSTAARTATNAASVAATNPATEHKPILAERFKTKPCQNFEKTGVCPYETRCMFAHGEHDLRTKEMNLAANLVTEEAIKNFQRERMIAEREAALSKTKGGKKAAGPKKPAVASPLTKKALAAPQPAAAAVEKSEKRVAPAGQKQAAAVPAPIVVAEPQRPSSPASDSPSTVAAPKSPRATPSSTTASTPMKKLSASTTTPARRYRHDPYAPVVIGVPVSAEPLPAEMSEEEQYAAYGYYQAACMCADCASPSSTVAASPLAQAMMYKQIATKYPEPCYCADCCHPDAMAEHADQILLC